MKRLLLILFVLISAQGWGQSLSDTSALRAWFDGAVETQMKNKKVPGATLAIVQHGKVVYAHGYGYADVKNNRMVNPDSTLFRIGSISKMFTWISVMQLVAQGKIDLNADVNQYLKGVQIPEKFGQPVTMKHLMTHTPGFEDLVIHLFGRDSTSLRPLLTILQQEMPDRVRPPYTQSSYSNHGTGIAALVVEQVSSMDFNDYVEQKVIRPLGMKYTTFRQPLPARQKPLMSKGYRQENGKPVEEIFEFVPLYPVGAASASARDMTKFMNALLHHGRADSVQLLDSATMALMQSPAHRHHPAVNPMRYGFMDMSQNGVNIIGHGGDTFWFHSLMALLPEHDLGIFLSFNSQEGGGAYMEVLESFIDHYFPEKPVPSAFKSNRKFLERFAGEYRANRFAYHDITTIANLSGRLAVRVVDSTRLEVATGSRTKRYVAIDSTTFREEASNDKIAFGFGPDKQVAHLYMAGLPIVAFDRVTGFDTSSTQTLLLVAILVLALVAVLYWPLLYRFRRGYQPLLRTKSALPSDSRFIAWLNYLLLLIFLVGLAVIFSNPFEIVYAVPGSIKVLLVIPFLMIILTLLMLIHLVRVVVSERYRLLSRLYYALLCVGSVLAIAELYYWHFVGYHY